MHISVGILKKAMLYVLFQTNHLINVATALKLFISHSANIKEQTWLWAFRYWVRHTKYSIEKIKKPKKKVRAAWRAQKEDYIHQV